MGNKILALVVGDVEELMNEVLVNVLKASFINEMSIAQKGD